MSSPCVWRDRIFLTAFDAGKLETHCYDRRDGKLIWKRGAGAETLEEFHAALGSPAASTPATDGRRVVSYFGSCGLICYDFEGKELWRHRLPVAQTAGGFGSGCSPVIAGRLVLLNRDQVVDSSLLAVDLRHGRKVWEASRPDASQSYGTPITWTHNGVNEVVMSGSIKLKGYDAKTGTERWSLDGMPSFTCTTPVVGEGLLFFAGWSPSASEMPSFPDMAKQADKDNDGAISLAEAKAAKLDSFFRPMDSNRDGSLTSEDFDKARAEAAKGKNVLVAVKPGGRGTLSDSAVAWKQTRGLPYVPSPLFYKGRVYLVRDGGMLSSFDAKTGEPYYQQERLGAAGGYYASPVAADGHIYLTSQEGRLTVVEAGGGTPRILHQTSLGEQIAATPALVGNTLIIRTAMSLFAFGN
jgi:outer membrane protein assembly factor BamB